LLSKHSVFAHVASEINTNMGQARFPVSLSLLLLLMLLTARLFLRT
jgi:hypothetical protein